MVGLGQRGLSRKEYYKKWKELNKVRIRKINSKWYQKNKHKHAKMTQEWRKKNVSRAKDIRDRWRVRHPERSILHGAKMRAVAEGIPFNLTAADIVIPTHCPVFGIKLNWVVGAGRAKNDIPSLDRLDPKLGYVKKNINVISWRANRLKSDGTLKEFEQLVHYLQAMIDTSSQSNIHDSEFLKDHE